MRATGNERAGSWWRRAGCVWGRSARLCAATTVRHLLLLAAYTSLSCWTGCASTRRPLPAQVVDEPVSISTAPPAAPLPVSVQALSTRSCVVLSDSSQFCVGDLPDAVADNVDPLWQPPECRRLPNGVPACRSAGTGDGDGRSERQFPGAKDAVEVVMTLAGWGGALCGRYLDGHVSCWTTEGEQRIFEGATQVYGGERLCIVDDARRVRCSGWGWPSAETVTTVAQFVGVRDLRVGRSIVCVASGRPGEDDIACVAWSQRFVEDDLVGWKLVDERVLEPFEVDAGPFDEWSVGTRHACGVDRDRRVWCWGDRRHGQLGDGGVKRFESQPVDLRLPADIVVSGQHHSCALAGGAVSCWGANESLQLGSRTVSPESVTPRPVADIGTVVSLASANHFTCAVDSDGRAWCWGVWRWNEQRAWSHEVQEGHLPTRMAVPGRVTSVVAAGASACFLNEQRRVFCWGERVGRFAPERVVELVALRGTPLLALDRDRTCGVLRAPRGLARARLSCVAGALALGDTDRISRKAAVAFDQVLDPVRIDRSCALDGSGKLWCLGLEGFEEPEFGRDYRLVAKELKSQGSFSDFWTPGGQRVCGRAKADGAVECLRYVLEPLESDESSPQTGTYLWEGGNSDELSMLEGLRMIAWGGRHACAVAASGGVVCWGDNTRGATGTLPRVFEVHAVEVDWRAAKVGEGRTRKGAAQPISTGAR